VIDDLEKQIEAEITGVEITFAGQHIKTVDYSGYRYTSQEGVVSNVEINELYNEAKNHKVEQDFKIIHIIPQSFIIDGEIKELNPVGIAGRKLEANYKLFIVPEIHILNLQRVFDKIGVIIEESLSLRWQSQKQRLPMMKGKLGQLFWTLGPGQPNWPFITTMF
jgi:cell division protein FtsA